MAAIAAAREAGTVREAAKYDYFADELLKNASKHFTITTGIVLLKTNPQVNYK